MRERERDFWDGWEAAVEAAIRLVPDREELQGLRGTPNEHGRCPICNYRPATERHDCMDVVMGGDGNPNADGPT